MERGDFSNEELPLPEWVDDFEERMLRVSLEHLLRLYELEMEYGETETE